MASSSTTPQIYNQQTTDRWELSIPITTKNFIITKQWIIIQYIDIVRGNHWLRIRVRHSSWKEYGAEMPLRKFIRAANRQSPVITLKFLPLCHRNTRLGCVLKNAMIYCTDEQGVQLKLTPSADWGKLCCEEKRMFSQAIGLPGCGVHIHEVLNILVTLWGESVFSGFQNQQVSSQTLKTSRQKGMFSHKIIKD